jgi:hypothetical protein
MDTKWEVSGTRTEAQARAARTESGSAITTTSD